MKKILLLGLIIIGTKIISAQSYEGKVEYQKKDDDALIIEFPYPPSVVEAAIIDKMEKLGNKGKEVKGFRTYKAISISEISSEKLDYMIKVDRKSRKEKDESIVYLVIKTGEGDVSDSRIRDNAKSFLNNLTPQVEAFNLERGIQDQEEILKKAEKKYKSLEDDQETIEKKIARLEKDLEENKSDQEKQRQEIEKQKEVLEAMRGKRRGF